MSYLMVAVVCLAIGYVIGTLTAHDDDDEGEVVGWDDQR